MGAVCGSAIAVDPKTHPVISPPLSFHRVFSLCVCHASCCHLKLMNLNDFTAHRRSVCMCCTVTGGRNSSSSSSTAGVCCGSETIWKLLCCSTMMDHAEGMSVALDFVTIHQGWVRENPFSPSIKDVAASYFGGWLMECLYDASPTVSYSEELFFPPSHLVFQWCFC